MDVIHALISTVLQFYHDHQFLGLFVLILIEEAGIPIPIPGDALVMIAGLEPHRGPLYALHVLALSSAAVFLGSSVLYMVARKGGRPFFRRYGRYILLHEERLAKMERWFTRWGRAAIIFGRLIPGLRIPTTIMAGISGVPPATYFPTAAVAGVIWSVVFFFLGTLVEHELRYVAAVVAGLLDLLSDSIVSAWVLIGLLAALAGLLHIRQVRRTNKRRRHLKATLGQRRDHHAAATAQTPPAPAFKSAAGNHADGTSEATSAERPTGEANSQGTDQASSQSASGG